MSDRIIYQKGQYDILFGQGAHAEHDAFHQVWLDFVYFLKPYYHEAQSNYEKKLFVQRVIDFVPRHGGAFIQRRTIDPVTFQELNEIKIYDKCGAVLRETRVTRIRMERPLRPFTVVEPDVFHPPPPARRGSRIVRQSQLEQPQPVQLQEHRPSVEEQMNVQVPPPSPLVDSPHIVVVVQPGQHFHAVPFFVDHQGIEEEYRNHEELVPLDEFPVAGVILGNREAILRRATSQPYWQDGPHDLFGLEDPQQHRPTIAYQFEDVAFTEVNEIHRNNATLDNWTDEAMWRDHDIETFSDLDEIVEDDFDVRGIFDDDFDMEVAGLGRVLLPPHPYHGMPLIMGQNDHMFDEFFDDMFDD